MVFAGFLPLALAVVGAVRCRRRRLAQFWAIFSAIFLLLALGPFLHVAGEIVRLGDSPVPLPYLLLYKVVPFIGISRSLSRFALMVMIGLGVLAAAGAARFSPKAQLLGAALICFEFIAAPFPMSPIDTPKFFETLTRDAEDYTIAVLPMNWDRPSPLLYQTVHGKRLLTAYTSRQNPRDLSRRTPVLQQWRALQDDIIKTDLAAVAPSVLRDFKVKYIVLDYYQMPPGPEREGTERWVAAALPTATPVYRDERLTVYQTPPVIEAQPYLQLGPEWGALTAVAGAPARLLSGEATLRFVRGRAVAGELRLETLPGHSLQALQAYAGQTVLPHSLSEDALSITLHWPPDVDTIRLVSSAPISISSLQINPP